MKKNQSYVFNYLWHRAVIVTLKYLPVLGLLISTVRCLTRSGLTMTMHMRFYE